jgi:hypothetical protein
MKRHSEKKSTEAKKRLTAGPDGDTGETGWRAG